MHLRKINLVPGSVHAGVAVWKRRRRAEPSQQKLAVKSICYIVLGACKYQFQTNVLLKFRRARSNWSNEVASPAEVLKLFEKFKIYFLAVSGKNTRIDAIIQQSSLYKQPYRSVSVHVTFVIKIQSILLKQNITKKSWHNVNIVILSLTTNTCTFSKNIDETWKTANASVGKVNMVRFYHFALPK